MLLAKPSLLAKHLRITVFPGDIGCFYFQHKFSWLKYNLNTIKIPKSKCDGYTRRLQINPPKEKKKSMTKHKKTLLEWPHAFLH